MSRQSSRCCGNSPGLADAIRQSTYSQAAAGFRNLSRSGPHHRHRHHDPGPRLAGRNPRRRLVPAPGDPRVSDMDPLGVNGRWTWLPRSIVVRCAQKPMIELRTTTRLPGNYQNSEPRGLRILVSFAPFRSVYLIRTLPRRHSKAVRHSLNKTA